MTYHAQSHVDESRLLKPLPYLRPVCLFILLSCPLHINAIPLHAPQSGPLLLEARQVDSADDGQGRDISVFIWVPILLLTLITLAILGAKLLKRRRLNAASAQAQNNNQTTTEVTAAQLAGQTTSASGATGVTATARPRRERRARRASQISVTSLPEYMKEPGDQELVIIRGRDTLDDDDEPSRALIMPDGALVPQHSRNDSEYSDIPDTPHDMPLLQPDGQDPFRTPSRNTGTRSQRVSFDTPPSVEDTPVQDRVPNSQTVLDPRGEAPPYFEVVDLSESASPPTQRPDQPQADTSSASAANSAAPDSPTPARRSGLRSLFSSRMSTTASPSSPASPTSPPVVPPPPTDRSETPASHLAHSREQSRSRASSHRPSHSASGSLLSLSPFRTISRQKSITSMNNHLTSPSMISLSSISSPLTHTVTRTEFTYPKSGPTPQQLKLISSREAFTKFGMPYGEDAIAYAATSSRVDLQPPPGFEEVLGPSNRPTTASSSGSEDESEAAQHESGGAQSVPTSGSGSATSPPQGPSESHGLPGPHSQPQSSGDQNTTTNGPVDGTASEPNDTAATSSQLGSSSQSASAPTTSGPSTAPASVSVVPPTPLQDTTQLAQAPPPTSFRFPAESRPESRASMTSFETAAETIGAGASDSDDDDSSLGGRATPPTPRMQPSHTLESTDATITQRSRGLQSR